MATTHISINSGMPWGAKLLALRDGLLRDINLARELKSKMDAMIDTVPNPDNFAALEAQFGLVTGEGKGAAAWGELSSVLLALESDLEPAAQAGDAAHMRVKLKQFIDLVG